MTTEIRNVRVRVTADHIAQGKPGNPCGCPVALALMAAGFDSANAFCGVLYAVNFREDGRHEQWRATPPKSVRDFIGQLDAGMLVFPFEFDAMMVAA